MPQRRIPRMEKDNEQEVIVCDCINKPMRAETLSFFLIFVKKVYIMRAGFVGGREINPINPARPRGFSNKNMAAMANFV